MSSREFAEWQAFAQIQPLGDLRADVRIAMLATLIAGALGAEGFDPWSFLPWVDKPEAEAGVTIAEPLQSGSGRPAPIGQARDPEAEAELARAEGLFDKFRTWAILEGAEAPELRGEGVTGGDSL